MKQTENKESKRKPQSLIQVNTPLYDKNWFGTGGSAQYFAAPETNTEFQAALQFTKEKQLPITMIGQGANMLISDEGVSGLVMQPQLNDIKINHDRVTAGAGVIMQDLIDACLDNNLIGLEEFSGIPGTVGGSVFINLHYFQFLLSDFLASAHVIHKHTGAIKQVDNAWFKFGYNDSTLHHQPYYLLDATFKLTPSTPEATAYARGRRAEIIRHRNARYPGKNTCGSFFRNFHPHEVTLESNGKKMIYVAYYLDKIGAKGQLQVGDAIVSWQHANMIVNKGRATTNDIIAVARQMQRSVYEGYGIMPQPECRLIGFNTYPLHSQ